MRQTHRYTQHLRAPAHEVFPLICPVREAEWLEGFEYDMVHSDSGVAELGCLFTTSRDGEPDTVWCITTHDRSAGRVEFHRVTPTLVATHIVVQLSDEPEGCTADITYTHTSLGPAGHAYVRERCGESAFLTMVQLWERSLNRYLKAA